MDLKTARQNKNLTQSSLSVMTGIAQPTLSNLEQRNISPTKNQRLLLEQALGPIEWPVNREFSAQESTQLVQAFAVLVNRNGPRQALDLLSATKNNDELRGVAGLFAPHVDVEVLTAPDYSSYNPTPTKRRN